MSPMDRAKHESRMATLRTVRLIVEDGTLVVRPKVLCEPTLRFHRLIPKTLLTY